LNLFQVSINAVRVNVKYWAWAAAVIRQMAMIVTATFRLHFIFITSLCELVTRVLRATFALHLSKAEMAGENCNTGEKSFSDRSKWVYSSVHYCPVVEFPYRRNCL
jgi:hypothetical protein